MRTHTLEMTVGPDERNIVVEVDIDERPRTYHYPGHRDIGVNQITNGRGRMIELSESELAEVEQNIDDIFCAIPLG